VSHNSVKSLLEMFCISSYTKMTKCELFWRFEITILRSTILSFLYRLIYKIFWTDIFARLWIHHSLLLEFCFNFF
jgi:hypothetical protein